MNIKHLLPILLFCISCTNNKPKPEPPKEIRIASYNVALFRAQQGDLAKDLQSGQDSQIQNVAAIIQQVHPDVIALLEFDYDPSEQLLKDFKKNYLEKSQHGQRPIHYKHQIQIPSNTGVAVDADYNNDGKIETPNDAYGYGKYEGQYAFALLSKYPLDVEEIRSFQNFLWKDMPDAKPPKKEDGTPYYSEKAWNGFRLSSKSHIDIPIRITKERNLHALIAHPTPPVFDGKEDRNGLRNFDEIRMLKDYISNEPYLVDDKGKTGGLAIGASFCVLGDLNADPIDGDSYPNAINQLLESSLVNKEAALGNLVPKSRGGMAHNKRKNDKGDPAHDTAFFGARIDYVLPSKDIKVLNSGVFWPTEGEPLYDAVKEKGASDHLMVWMDLVL